MSDHAYPTEFAQFVSSRWELAGGDLSESEGPKGFSSDLERLEPLLTVCYQASLLREELRPVMLRVIFCQPSFFPQGGIPPEGFHILEFDSPRPFTPQELRALSHAANFHRSLVGVGIHPNGALHIWGIVHSGPRWLRELHGGRKASASLPSAIVIRVNAPGYLEVCRGSHLVGQLRDGEVTDGSMNVFESSWLPESFSGFREELFFAHEKARRERGHGWGKVNPQVGRILGQQMVKRLIAAVQASHHGGILLTVPPERADSLLGENPYLHIKYRFQAVEPCSRYRSLLLSILERLAEVGGEDPEMLIDWHHYESTTDARLMALDEALFEMSYLIAGLAAVDGAVVLTKRFDILGFGAEIKHGSSALGEVACALDIEGERTIVETLDGFGTRHRSAYRFANDMPEAVAIVISQDGGVQFVRKETSRVTYWNHGPSMQTTPA